MRQVKFFKVRLAPSELKADETWLNEFLARTRARKIVPDLVQTPRETFWSVYVEFDASSGQAGKAAPEPELTEAALPESARALYGALKEWRAKKSAELGQPSYVIFHNRHLLAMAQTAPTSALDLVAIPGVGQAKITKYAEDVLRVVADHRRHRRN